MLSEQPLLLRQMRLINQFPCHLITLYPLRGLSKLQKDDCVKTVGGHVDVFIAVTVCQITLFFCHNGVHTKLQSF